jgi:hypothetical protein
MVGNNGDYIKHTRLGFPCAAVLKMVAEPVCTSTSASSGKL